MEPEDEMGGRERTSVRKKAWGDVNAGKMKEAAGQRYCVPRGDTTDDAHAVLV